MHRESLGPGPSERLAFVLHDLFAVPLDEIGKILGESTATTKMFAGRARRKVQTIERPTGFGREQQDVVQAFLPVARRGNFEELPRLLDPEVKPAVDTRPAWSSPSVPPRSQTDPALGGEVVAPSRRTTRPWR